VRSDTERLRDILESIEAIRRHTDGGRAAFESDELVRTSVIHWIGVIGEAAGRISDGLQAEHPEIPWPEIVAMRNRLFHAYFDISAERIWEAVEQDLPDLEEKVSALLAQLDPGPA
jgi:uncharacterized protein with HEPN domain